MILLAIDTSSHLGSVAVVGDGVLLAEINVRVRARHGETLLPHVEHVIRLSGLTVEDLSLLAVGLGPGSFTGLRVGVATAKGLALSLDLPLVGVPSLRALARAFGHGAGVAVPVLDAHKGEVFAAAYETGARLVERVAPFHASPAEAARSLREALGADEAIVAGGDGLRRYPKAIGAAFGDHLHTVPAVLDTPRASLVAVEALALHQERGADDLAGIEPLYVRPSDARLPSRPATASR